MQRFRELDLQSRGFDAYNDANVQQKIKLTPEQRKKLSEYSQDFSRRIDAVQKQGKDGPATAKAYEELERKNRKDMESVLTPEQRRLWGQMTGEPYYLPLYQATPKK